MKLSYVLIILSILLSSFTALAQTANRSNPDLGVNLLFLYQHSNTDKESRGFRLQEAEVSWSADVDPYHSGVLLLGLHSGSHAEEGASSHSDSVELDVEEAYVKSLATQRWSYKLGKFLLDFGKTNSQHTHAMALANRSFLSQYILGEESLSSVGAEVSGLIPASWFSEWKLYGVQASSEHVFAETHRALAYGAKWKNLWNLNEDTTFELGVSGILFKDRADAGDLEESKLQAVDLGVKWLRNQDQNFTWHIEALRSKREGSETTEVKGYNTWLQYKWQKNWLMELRAEESKVENSSEFVTTNAKAMAVVFFPSEFSSMRTQLDQVHKSGNEIENKISLQWNFSLGVHPAHAY